MIGNSESFKNQKLIITILNIAFRMSSIINSLLIILKNKQKKKLNFNQQLLKFIVIWPKIVNFTDNFFQISYQILKKKSKIELLLIKFFPKI